jgi:hypothetical protein
MTWLRGVRGSRPNVDGDCVGADGHTAWDDLVRFLNEVEATGTAKAAINVATCHNLL